MASSTDLKKLYDLYQLEGVKKGILKKIVQMETKDSNKSSFVRVQESQSSESPVLSSRSQ